MKESDGCYHARKSNELFRSAFKDIEVQMLSIGAQLSKASSEEKKRELVMIISELISQVICCS